MRDERIAEAIRFALEAHRRQRRKGGEVLYVWHPLAVGRLLDEAGASTETVIAGILHDTLEDTPVTAGEIEARFGAEVAAIVRECTEEKSLPWEVRKAHTIEMLEGCRREVALVTAADKYDNLASMLRELPLVGEALWERFNRGRQHQRTYFEGVVASLRRNPAVSEHPLVALLAETCATLFESPAARA